MARNKVIFYLNGEKHEASGHFAQMMLSEYLRHQLNLSGTKVVCSEGDCGACTVLKLSPVTGHSRIATGSKKTDSSIQTMRNSFLPINSCIAPVATLDGCHLITVEALAKSKSELNHVQSKMVEHHGSQCGFCTPGFVMALSGLAEKRVERQDLSPLKEKEVRNALTGNLCRCTGYAPIIEAGLDLNLKNYQSLKQKFFRSQFQEDLIQSCKSPLAIKEDRFSVYAPTSLPELKRILKAEKQIRIIGAATDLGVVHNKGKTRLTHFISLHRMSELYELSFLKKNMLKVGARVTLTELREITKEICPEFSQFLDIFASPQIKNVATLVGNLVNASPIGDTLPFLLATDAQIHTQGTSQKRTLPISNFFLDYRKTALKKNEVVTHISFHIPNYIKLFKVSTRKDLDISAVALAFSVLQNKKNFETRVALGGVAATPIRLGKVEKYLNENDNSEVTLRASLRLLESQIKPLSDARGSAAFRKLLVKNLFTKALTDYQAQSISSEVNS